MDDEFDARLRQALRDRAEQAGRPDDVFGELRRRSARRRRRQHLAVSVAALVALAVPAVGGLSRLLPDGDQEVFMGEGNTLEVEEPPPGQTVEVPSRGTAQGTTFDDGTPVLVVHDAKGEVRVFHARSPVSEDGRRGQLGWCKPPMSAEGRLVDPVAGRQWRPDGGPMLLGSGGDNPAARGQSGEPRPLVGYTVEGEAQDEEVSVGDPHPVEAEPSITTTEESAHPRNADSLPVPCPPGEIVSPPSAGEPAAVTELDGLSDGTYRVTATLEQVGDDPARLCPTPEGLGHEIGGPASDDFDTPVCGDDAITVPGTEALSRQDPGLADVRAGEFSVSLRDGAVERIVISASSRHGSAVVGGELILAGSLVPAGEDRPPGPPPPEDPPPELEDSQPPGPPDRSVPLPPYLVDVDERDRGHPESAVGLADHEVVDGPEWFVEEGPPRSPAGDPPDFRLPLASDANITVDGESLARDEFISQVEDGDLEGHEVTVTVDRASGRTVEVRSRDAPASAG